MFCSKCGNKIEPKVGEKIGGWLYLIAIGMILSPIINAYHVRQIASFVSKVNWEIMWGTVPIAVWAVAYELAMQVYMLIYSTVLAFLFFGKKSKLPKIFMIYIVSLFLLGLIWMLIIKSVPSIDPQLAAESIKFPVKVFLAGIIWIPYFVVSKRVKRTFVIGGNASQGDTMRITKILFWVSDIVAWILFSVSVLGAVLLPYSALTTPQPISVIGVVIPCALCVVVGVGAFGITRRRPLSLLFIVLPIIAFGAIGEVFFALASLSIVLLVFGSPFIMAFWEVRTNVHRGEA